MSDPAPIAEARDLIESGQCDAAVDRLPAEIPGLLADRTSGRLFVDDHAALHLALLHELEGVVQLREG